MDQLEILNRINELEREISALPPGNISVKKVKGKEYYYHRFTKVTKGIFNYTEKQIYI